MHNFKEFLDYCESFYLPSHPDVLYPIDGLTRGELALATLSYLDLCASSDGTINWGEGDSLDRERVRDFVINRRALWKLTKNELAELKYHYVDRIVENMATKDLVQYVFDDMLRYVENQSDVEFIDEAQNYWEDHFDDVVKDIKEYANSRVKKPIEDREASNFFINTNGEEN